MFKYKNNVSIFLVSLISVFFILSCNKKDSVDNKNKTLLISSAISLKNTLQEISSLYTNANRGSDIIFNFASSGELENQIMQGANVDIFISASVKQIDRLKEKNMLLEDIVVKIAKGELVVVASKKTESSYQIPKTNYDFLFENNYRYIAIGETNTVPAGDYAAEFLINSGLMKSVYSKLVYGRNVGEVLTWAETGNSEYAIVYKSDSVLSDKVTLVFNIDSKFHKEIIYQAAVIKTSKNKEEAREFISFLQTEEAQNIFYLFGFK